MKSIYDAAEEPLKGLENGIKCRKPSTSLQGPKRAIRLCLLGILIPALLISVPLYLRYRVYDPQLYPMAVSDMRTIDGKISTTWCQGNVIHSNISFNAFLMPGQPKIAPTLKQVQMTRHLLLDDDMKEYWGFYLLKGSKVIVSSCSRQPGASLVIIKGHRHLHECAYIGDDSSEESDEMREIAEEEKTAKLQRERGKTTAPTNRMDMLKKHRPEVSFEMKDAAKKNSTFSKLQRQEQVDETPLKTAKEMRELLSKLSDKRITRAKGAMVLPNTGEQLDKDTATHNHHKTFDNDHRTRTLEFGKGQAGNVAFGTVAEENNEVTESSQEILKSLIRKMRKLGPRGRKIIEMLQRESMASEEKSAKDASGDSTTPSSTVTTASPISDEKIERVLRNRRDLILKTALSLELNADDEMENLAKEEGFVPDGHADHHKVVNETTLNDRSDSEIWSSFSSSEEALLECPGLIMSLPLTPSRSCVRGRSDSQLREEFSPNTITFTVTANGYYFFVFSSENEVERNYVRTSFNIKKAIYDVSHPVAKCNATLGKCTLPLDFLSNEQVVIELPADESRNVGRNEEYILVSECQPRTSLYLLCILAVPFMILAFAFQ